MEIGVLYIAQYVQNACPYLLVSTVLNFQILSEIETQIDPLYLCIASMKINLADILT